MSCRKEVIQLAGKRHGRSFSVVVKYAQESTAPTLDQLRAEASLLVAQLLAHVIAKREQK
jgi:hypothetical protein